MENFLYTIVSFIVAISILVTFHEFGHYWVAKRCGVKVLRFSLGFGKPLWSKRFGPDREEFVVAAIPMGGYVKMLDEREGPVAQGETHRAFNTQSLSKRSAIVLAGPVANLLLAILLYAVVNMLGTFETRPEVGEVLTGSVAEAGGFESGDKLLSIDSYAVTSWEQFIERALGLALDGQTVEVGVQHRDGAERIRILNLEQFQNMETAQGFVTNMGLKPARPIIRPVIDAVTQGGPAERAGLRQGDLILVADGQAIESWSQWVEYVRARPDQGISVDIQRSGEELGLMLRPQRIELDGSDFGRIGARVLIDANIMDPYRVYVQYGPIESLQRAVGKTADMSVLMVSMLGKMLIGDVSTKSLSGPISIAQYAGQTAQIGFTSFLKFLAVISVSLGVLNLLPVPVLDGGHLLFFCIEAIKGSPVTADIQLLGQKIGVALLLALMSLAFYQDIVRLIEK